MGDERRAVTAAAGLRRSVRAVAHVALADYRERVRRHGFRVTLAITLYFAYLFLPPNGARYATVQIGETRGLYGSAWVGCSVALLTSAFLSLVGFYLVRNAVERDRRTGVGEILATTPLGNAAYTLGKGASHFAVLATLTLLVAVGAMGMQLLRGEDSRLDPLAVLAPFAVVTLPAMAVVAGLAVLFEAVPGLRGAAGNFVYFFVWSLGLTMLGGLARVHGGGGIGDALGSSAVLPELLRGTAAAFPDIDPGTVGFNIGFNITDRARHFRTFDWSGPVWTVGILAPRLAWGAIGVALAAVAAIPFDRFDPARARPRPGRRRRAPARAAADEESADAGETPRRGARDRARVLPAPAARGFAFGGLLAAEWRLVLGSAPRLLWLIALGLAIAGWIAPPAFGRQWLLPFVWIVPLLAWSGLGAREARHGTEALVFSAPRPISRQLPGQWTAGFAVAAAAGSGVLVRLAAAGEGEAALGVLSGAVFIPSLALACGAWTGSGRLFEALYPLLWYVGPMQKVPFLDFAATTPAALEAGAPAGFAAAAVALAALAAAGRARRLRR